MAKVDLTGALRSAYEELFESCDVRAERAAQVDDIVTRLLENRERYERVGGSVGTPWSVVAVLHNMEASLNFGRHLHNGDPLTARTVHVPAERPRSGSPPFTWEESAVDALTMRELQAWKDWSVGGTLYQIEGYNGWGYRAYHPDVLSPYLWSFSKHYNSGKYVADGTWSATAVSQQCGAAVLLRRLGERGNLEFSDQPAPVDTGEPMVVDYSMSRSTDPVVVAQVEALQRWLTTFPGIFVKVDGIPGTRTSDAYRSVTGKYLPSDPRG